MSELYALKLSKAEALHLDGTVNREAQAVIDGIKEADAVAARFSGLAEKDAAFIHQILDEARTNGRLVCRHVSVMACSLCERKAEYRKYKSGFNRGRVNLNKPPIPISGIELAQRFVVMAGYPTLGCCRECFERLKLTIVEVLSDVRAALPNILRSPGATTFARWNNRHCKKCGWSGHEGEMRPLLAIMGGHYQGGCPNCAAENGLGRTEIEVADGFQVVEVTP